MKTHKIVTVRLPVTTTDIGGATPLPPFRLTPSTLEQRSLQNLAQRADLYALFTDLCNETVEAETVKEAADQALQTLSGRMAAAWSASGGSTVEIVKDQIVYRKLPNGQHETIGYLMETLPGGQRQPVVVDVDEGDDRYRCFVHVALTASELTDSTQGG